MKIQKLNEYIQHCWFGYYIDIKGNKKYFYMTKDVAGRDPDDASAYMEDSIPEPFTKFVFQGSIANTQAEKQGMKLVECKSIKEDINDSDEVLNFKRDVESANDIDEIQQLIYELSDGVAEDNCQTAFYENEGKSLSELKNSIIVAIDNYLEDNEWLDESKSIKESRPDKDNYRAASTKKVTIKYGNSAKEAEICKPIKVTTKQLKDYKDNYSFVDVLDESKSITESNIKHIYYHNDPVTSLKNGQWLDVKEEDGKLFGKWNFKCDDDWYEIKDVEEMPYHNFHGAKPAKTFTWGGWRHWLDDEVEKFWDIEGKRVTGDFEIPGMPHVKRTPVEESKSINESMNWTNGEEEYEISSTLANAPINSIVFIKKSYGGKNKTLKFEKISTDKWDSLNRLNHRTGSYESDKSLEDKYIDGSTWKLEKSTNESKSIPTFGATAKKLNEAMEFGTFTYIQEKDVGSCNDIKLLQKELNNIHDIFERCDYPGADYYWKVTSSYLGIKVEKIKERIKELENESLSESKESEESELITQYINNGEFDKLEKVQDGTNVIWKLKEPVEEGIEPNITPDISIRPYDNEEGKIDLAKWYAAKYPDDEVGIEQLDGLTMEDALKDRNILDHCDTQVRERVCAQLDKYLPIEMNESTDEDVVYNLPFGWEPNDKLGNRFKYSNDDNIIYVSLNNSIADTNHITVSTSIIDKHNADNAKELKYSVYVDDPGREWHNVAVNAMLRAKDELRKQSEDIEGINEASEGFQKEFYKDYVILKNRAGDGWDIYSYDGTPEKVKKAYLEDEGFATLQAAKDEIDKWEEESKLDEASYGGAFDIADDQYFTREDIENAAEEVMGHITETFTEPYHLGGTWFENGQWIVNVQGEQFDEYEISLPIDMRKIKEPWHLKRAYANEMAAKLIGQIKEYNGLNEDTAVSSRFEFDDDVDDLSYYYDDEVFNNNLEDSPYTEIASKQVPDSDGFMTDYTMYMNINTGEYVFVFGDKDVYSPDDGNFDWECDTEAEAQEWFNNYTGFADEDDNTLDWVNN